MKDKENTANTIYQTTTRFPPTSLKLAPHAALPLQPPFSQTLHKNTPVRPPPTSRQFVPSPLPSPTARSPLRASAPVFRPSATSPIAASPTRPSASAYSRAPPTVQPSSPHHTPERPPLLSPRLIPVYYAPPSRANDPPLPRILPLPRRAGAASREAHTALRQLPASGTTTAGSESQAETLIYTHSDMVTSDGPLRACIGTWTSGSDGPKNRADCVYASDALYGASLAIALAVEDAIPYARRAPVVVLTTNSAALTSINLKANIQPRPGTPAYHVRTLLALSGAQVTVRLAEDAAKDGLTRKLWTGARALAKAMFDARPEIIVLDVRRRTTVLERAPLHKPRWPSSTPTTPASGKTNTEATNTTTAQAPGPEVTSIYVSGCMHPDEMSALIGMWVGTNDARNLSGRFACAHGGARMAAILAVAAGVEAAVRLERMDNHSGVVEVVCAELEDEVADAITSLRPSTPGPVNFSDAEAEAIRHVRCKLGFASGVRVRSAAWADAAELGILGAQALGDGAKENGTIPGRWVGGKLAEKAPAITFTIATADPVRDEVANVEQGFAAIALEEKAQGKEDKNVEREEHVAVRVGVETVKEDVVTIGASAVEKQKIALEEEREVVEEQAANVDKQELSEHKGEEEEHLIESDGFEVPEPTKHAPNTSSSTADHTSLEPADAPSAHVQAPVDTITSASSLHVNEQFALDSRPQPRRKSMRRRSSSARLARLSVNPSDELKPASFQSLAETIHTLHLLTSFAYASLVLKATPGDTSYKVRVPDTNLILHARDIIRKWNEQKSAWQDMLPHIASEIGRGDYKSLTIEENEIRLAFCQWAGKVQDLDTLLWPDIATQDVCADDKSMEIVNPGEPVTPKLSKAARRRRNRKARLTTALALAASKNAADKQAPVLANLPISSKESEHLSSTPDNAAIVDLVDEPCRPSSTFQDADPDGEDADDEGGDGDDEPLDSHEREQLARAEEMLSRWDDLTEEERREAQALAQSLVSQLLPTADDVNASKKGKAEVEGEIDAFLEEEDWAPQEIQTIAVGDEILSGVRDQQAGAQYDPDLDADVSMAYAATSYDAEIAYDTSSVATTNPASPSMQPDVALAHAMPLHVTVNLNQGITVDPWTAIADYGDSSDDEDAGAKSNSPLPNELDATVPSALPSPSPSRLNAPPSTALQLPSPSSSPPSTPRRQFLMTPIAPLLRRISPIPAAPSSQAAISPPKERAASQSPSQYMVDVEGVQRKAERQLPLTPREEVLLEKHAAWTAARSSPLRPEALPNIILTPTPTPMPTPAPAHMLMPTPTPTRSPTPTPAPRTSPASASAPAPAPAPEPESEPTPAAGSIGLPRKVEAAPAKPALISYISSFLYARPSYWT
ncbi:unnamed protein product [Peniophora sp. CBMAI 1063]|nr:unnamed protein product [Peniophora sp. CBMAI 1063]